MKNIASKLLEKYSGQFTIDFEVNKKLVDKLIGVESKHLRNRVAGYITCLMKIRQRQAPPIPEAVPSPTPLQEKSSEVEEGEAEA